MKPAPINPTPVTTALAILVGSVLPNYQICNHLFFSPESTVVRFLDTIVNRQLATHIKV